MYFINKIVNSFRTPDLTKRICQMCSSNTHIDEHESSILLSQLTAHSSPQTVISELVQYFNTSPHVSRVKFTSMLLMSEQTNNLNQFIDILHLRLIKSCHKATTVMEIESEKIVSNLLFYFVRSIKKEYKEKIKQGHNESTVSMNRLYINFAYKFINEISSILALESSFAKLLEKYSGVAYIEQIYVLIVKQLNLLYECFKHSMNYYFTGFDREQVLENIDQIKQLIVSNKQIYRKMRQFHGISDYIIKSGKDKEKYKVVEKLVEYADVPYNIYKWLSKMSKIQTAKSLNSQADIFTSRATLHSANTMSHITADE